MKILTDGVVLSVRIQPRSSRNQVVSDGESLKVYLTTPPVDGAANEACIALLAKTLGIAKHCIVILSGEKSRSKIIKISGVDINLLISKFDLNN